jgi:7-carboxy-7-deazaguanine synthase
MSIPEILKEVKKHPEIKLIELTGGEPLQMLPEINELIGVLTDAAYYVDIETNGSLPLPPLGDYSLRHVSIIMDVKTPSSKMHKTTNLNHLKNLREQDAVKYVISNKEDLDYSFKIYKKYPTKASSWFSPCWGTIEPRVVAEAILESKLPIFMSLQLHKIMYPPDQRGV